VLKLYGFPSSNYVNIANLALLEKDSKHPIEIVGEKLRSMMPWLKKKE